MSTPRHRPCFRTLTVGVTLTHTITVIVLAMAFTVTCAMPTSLSAQVGVVRGPYLQTGTQTNLIVRWRTDLPTSSFAAYGTNAILLDRSVSNPTLKTNHSLLLPNLNPNTRYYYAIGDDSTPLAWGPDYNFVTAPDQAKPVRMWVIGDSGTASAGNLGSHAVRDAYYNYMGTNDTDVWLMLGDNAYYSGLDSEYQVAMFNTYSNLLRTTPVWSTIGNHETYGAETNGHIAYYDIFSHPQDGQAGGVPSGSRLYYSFDYANIHFVCLDSEVSDRTTNGPMHRWLRQDLLENTNDWLIAFWHTPPYSKGSHNSDTEPPLIVMRNNFNPILEQFGADLVLCGHSHNYERSYLINGHYGLSSTLVPSMILNSGSGRTNETGPYRKSNTGPSPNSGTVYIVAGSSGWATFTTGSHPVMHTQRLAIGSLVLDVNGNRLDAKFLRDTGVVEDYFTLIKGADAQPFKLVGFNLGRPIETLSWNSIAGRTYQVERSDELTPPDWLPASPVINATGVVTHWTNAFPGAGSEAFYRVVEFSP